MKLLLNHPSSSSLSTPTSSSSIEIISSCNCTGENEIDLTCTSSTVTLIDNKSKNGKSYIKKSHHFIDEINIENLDIDISQSQINSSQQMNSMVTIKATNERFLKVITIISKSINLYMKR